MPCIPKGTHVKSGSDFHKASARAQCRDHGVKKSETINRMKMPQGRPAKSRGGQRGRQGRKREHRLNLKANIALEGGVRNRETNFHLRDPRIHPRLAFARSGNIRLGSTSRRLGAFAATTALGVRRVFCGGHRFGAANTHRIGQNQG